MKVYVVMKYKCTEFLFDDNCYEESIVDSIYLEQKAALKRAKQIVIDAYKNYKEESNTNSEYIDLFVDGERRNGLSSDTCYKVCFDCEGVETWIEEREVDKTGIDDLSDGFHTFNQLYYQRMVLFSILVKQFKDKSWKSYKHEDGEECFGGDYFIVGIDTPEGPYTYHYKTEYWDWFDCEELPVSKHWDGHIEEDVTRLLSL